MDDGSSVDSWLSLSGRARLEFVRFLLKPQRFKANYSADRDFNLYPNRVQFHVIKHETCGSIFGDFKSFLRHLNPAFTAVILKNYKYFWSRSREKVCFKEL